MKKIVLLVFLFPCVLSAQNIKPCYTALRDSGMLYIKRKDYGEAISQFVAALVTCKDVPADNDLSSRIEDSKRRWANDLQASVTEAKNAFRDAVMAKDAAESAKSAEAKARQQAEENARRAYNRGIRAESFRLALLADMAGQRGLKSDALLLSWLGIQMSDTLQPYLKHAFAAAVRDSFTTTFFSSPAPIIAVAYLSGDNHVLLQTATQQYFIINTGEPVSVVQLPAEYAQVVPAAKGGHLLAWSNTNAFVINTSGKIEATLKGHTEPIIKAVFSPDGDNILTCSRDNTARVWDSNGNLLCVLEGHSGNVQSGAFSTDGLRVLTTSADGSSKVWGKKGNLIGTVRDTASFVTRAFFSAENLVFSQHSNGSVRISALDGQLKTTMGTKYEKCWGLQASPDFNYFMVGGVGGKIYFFKASGEKIATLAHGGEVRGFSFSSDNQSLLTWGADHVIWRWDLNGKLIQQYKGHRQPIQQADYSIELNMLLSTATDGNSKIWDAAGNVNAEWEAGVQKTANPHFSASLKQVLSIGNEGKSVMLSPIPKEIYAQINVDRVLKSQELEQLKKRYDIQFLESIGK